MAIHADSPTLVREVIEEYLTIAAYCVTNHKADGGVYGYPATMLLFCIVEALGNSVLAGSEPFRVLNEPYFGCNLSNLKVKKLESWYRNLLAHNGMIAPGSCLELEAGAEPFDFVDGEPVRIRVKPFYDLVYAAWQQFDKSRVNTISRPELSPEISKPVDFSGASLIAPSASGSNYAGTRRPVGKHKVI